jgi:hypothetical protein
VNAVTEVPVLRGGGVSGMVVTPRGTTLIR